MTTVSREEVGVLLMHRGTVRIETARLILRPFDCADARDMFQNWAADPEVTRYLSWPPHKDLSETEALLSAWCALYDDPRIYNWAVELRKTGEVVGNVSLVDRSDRHESCELGYCLSKRFRGLGIMPEAVCAVISFLFDKVGFHRVQARHRLDNPASGRVMQKCGMAYEGTLRGCYLTREGNFTDLCVYGITRDMYERQLRRTKQYGHSH